MKLLYVTANPKPVELSFSLQVGDRFLEILKSLGKDIIVEKVDVFKDEIPLIDATVMGAWEKLERGGDLSEIESSKIDRMNEILEQFLENDVYVFVTPLWNLGYPPLLKAYIDNIVVARKTFKYTESGAVGLLKGKTAIHIQAAGGVHSHGPIPEYAEQHLRGIMTFLGVEEYHHIVAEGMAFDPSRTEEIMKDALKKAETLAGVIADKA